MVSIVEKFIPLGKGRGVYVRIANPNGKNTPFLVCHGGPGSTHNSLELLDPLSSAGDRPIYYYDQFGCGLSSFAEDVSAYTPEAWVDELQAIRSYFHLDNVFLLGHSWGGMLVQLYLRKFGQKGINGIVLSSTLCSSKQWSEETHRLCKLLSSPDQKAIAEAEATGDYSSAAFQKASEHYLKMTVSDIDFDDTSVPECLTRKKKTGQQAYVHAWGVSEFTPTGLLKDYDTRPFLPSVSCSCLILYGGKDESTELQNNTMFDLIGSKKKEIHCFEGSRHMTYFEKNSEYISVVSAFLNGLGKL